MSAGDSFGMLTVTEVLGRAVRVRCACGRRKRMPQSQLLRGFKSCGCVPRRAVAWWPTQKAWALA